MTQLDLRDWVGVGGDFYSWKGSESGLNGILLVNEAPNSLYIPQIGPK